MSSPATSYDDIAPTGWLTAYGRSFSNIPYAAEVFAALDDLRNKGDSADLMRKMKDTELAPKFEARYKLLTKLLEQSGAQQILEVAAGLSTRGLHMTENPHVTYVELDLPVMTADKRAIFRTLEARGKITAHINLYIEDGNALELSDLQRAARHFTPKKPLTILTEGLLRYFTPQEQAIYADHMVQLLKQFGGAWITPDISVEQAALSDGTTTARRAMISGVTGKDTSGNRFRDLNAAEEFFTSKGLQVTQHRFVEVIDELTTPAALQLIDEQVRKSIGHAVVFVLRLA